MERGKGGRPKYRLIADDLRSAITSGTYRTGQALPSNRELSARYQVASLTVRQALDVLAAEGVIEIRHGSGAYVQEVPIARRVRRIPHKGDHASSFAVEMLRLGLEPSTKLIDTSIQEADGRVPELLGIPTGAPVLVRRRHMFADNRLVQLATSYLPMDVVGSLGVVAPDINPAKLYERLADKGYRATSWVEEVEVRRADSEEAPLLGVAEGQPVFEVIRQMNADDRVLDVAVNVLAAYRWRLVYAWDGE